MGHWDCLPGRWGIPGLVISRVSLPWWVLPFPHSGKSQPVGMWPGAGCSAAVSVSRAGPGLGQAVLGLSARAVRDGCTSANVLLLLLQGLPEANIQMCNWLNAWLLSPVILEINFPWHVAGMPACLFLSFIWNTWKSLQCWQDAVFSQSLTGDPEQQTPSASPWSQDEQDPWNWDWNFHCELVKCWAELLHFQFIIRLFHLISY